MGVKIGMKSFKVDTDDSALFQDPCVICASGFDEDLQAVKLKCGHTFHAACIIAWKEKAPEEERLKCPICRTTIGELPEPEADKKDDEEAGEKKEGDGEGENEGGDEQQSLISGKRSAHKRR